MINVLLESMPIQTKFAKNVQNVVTRLIVHNVILMDAQQGIILILLYFPINVVIVLHYLDVSNVSLILLEGLIVQNVQIYILLNLVIRSAISVNQS